MRVSIAGRHLDITNALKLHVESRLDKVRHHFDKVIDVDVVLSVEKHRHIAEITVHANGVHIHGKESSQDMYASVDTVIAKIDRQIRKFKDRSQQFQPRIDKTALAGGEASAESPEAEPEEPETEAASETEAVGERRLVRERLPLKPMNVGEAARQLDLANDPFMVFSNAETQQLNVIYARQDGAYGLIEPEF